VLALLFIIIMGIIVNLDVMLAKRKRPIRMPATLEQLNKQMHK